MSVKIDISIVCNIFTTGMGDATNGHHKYWIMKDQASAQDLDLLCRTEVPGASKYIFHNWSATVAKYNIVDSQFLNRREKMTVSPNISWMNLKTLQQNSMSLVNVFLLIYGFMAGSHSILCMMIAGLKVDQEFPGIYEWHRVDTSTNPDAASLAFSNWTPSGYLHSIFIMYSTLNIEECFVLLHQWNNEGWLSMSCSVWDMWQWWWRQGVNKSFWSSLYH